METETRATSSQSAPTTPAVSVVVPAYNVAPFISETLDSVFAQTFTDYEVIVVNDGSPDTDELERALAPYRERIHYLRQENRGPSAARNAAIMHARAPLVALLDGDDLWLPEKLAEQMNAFEEDPATDMLYADARIFGNTALAGESFMQRHPSRGEVTVESLLRLECSVLTSTVVARRQSFIDAGLFDERFHRAEDFDLWVRMAHAGARIRYQRKVLAGLRRHGQSLTSDYLPMYESQLKVFAKLRDTLTLAPAEREALDALLRDCEARMSFERGKRAFIDGRYAEAAASIASANRVLRSRKLSLALILLRAAPRPLRWAYIARHRSSPSDAMVAVRR